MVNNKYLQEVFGNKVVSIVESDLNINNNKQVAGIVESDPNIDLTHTNRYSFLINLSQNSNISCKVTDNFGQVPVGKSGEIVVKNANYITGFSPPFNWRITQSGFSGTEVFSYFVESESMVRIVRS